MRMVFIFLLFVLSCSDYETVAHNYERDQPQAEEAVEPTFREFSTRLTNNLLISGERCEGNETADFGGENFTCNKGNWLIVVDNINSCTPDGCTDVMVQPTIATLQASSADQLTTFFDIVPTIPVNPETERILNSVFVRERTNEEPIVIFK